MDSLFEVAKSVQSVVIQGIRNGQEMAERKYQPLLEAAKKAKAFIATTDNYNDGGEPANRLMQELTEAIAQVEGH